MKLVSRKIFRNKAFSPKIKILLWRSLIRSAMAYGLRAREIPRHLLEKMEAYMYKHLRMMMNLRWQIDEWYPD